MKNNERNIPESTITSQNDSNFIYANNEIGQQNFAETVSSVNINGQSDFVAQHNGSCKSGGIISVSQPPGTSQL